MCRILALAGLILSASVGLGQNSFTWTGGGTDTFLSNAANWTPTGGPPGSTSVTTNNDVALFGNVGTNIGGDPTSPTGNLYIGSFVTTAGSSGGVVNISATNNTTLTLNGGFVLGSFTNVVAAAQGRDLTLSFPTSTIRDGTPDITSTIYAAPGRTLTLQANVLDTSGSATNVEGGGKVILLGNINANGATVSVNAGVFAFKGNVSGLAPNSTLGTGALLQGGLAAGDNQGIGPVNFANSGGVRVLVNPTGTTPNVLTNGNFTSNGAIFRIQVSREDDSPLTPGTYAPGTIMNGTFTNFGATGTYNSVTSPGKFQVEGNGFVITDWTVELTSNELRLTSYTAVVPEPGSILAVAGLGLAGWIRMKRSWRRGSNR